MAVASTTSVRQDRTDPHHIPPNLHLADTPSSASHHVPTWILQECNAPAYAIRTWREKGWLTPANRRRANGQGFAWHRALEQIWWLEGLYMGGRSGTGEYRHRSLDREDAAGGWRLRGAGAEWGIRLDQGLWHPVENPEDLLGGPYSLTVLAGHHQIRIAQVRP